MKEIYSYVSILCAILTIASNGYCDEISGEPNTMESEVSPVPRLDGSSMLTESTESSTIPESEDVFIPSEEINSTLPEPENTLIPSEETTSLPESETTQPDWWVPMQPDNISSAENEIVDQENKTSDEDQTSAPFIIMKYPLVGSPEILVGSFVQENGTLLFEIEKRNNGSEEELDIGDLNITELSFPVEGEIDVEIGIDTPNDTYVWVDELFLLPVENVTEEIGNNTEVVTTNPPNQDEKEQTETNFATEQTLDVTDAGSVTEPSQSSTNTIPVARDMEMNEVPV